MSTEDYPPARVHITGSDIPLAGKPPRRCRRGLSARSFTLTAADPAQAILPQSDSRTEAWIVSMTNPCVIGASKGDVQAGGNAAATIPVNVMPVPVNTTDELWASAGTLPTTISVLAIYEQPEP